MSKLNLSDGMGEVNSEMGYGLPGRYGFRQVFPLLPLSNSRSDFLGSVRPSITLLHCTDQWPITETRRNQRKAGAVKGVNNEAVQQNSYKPESFLVLSLTAYTTMEIILITGVTEGKQSVQVSAMVIVVSSSEGLFGNTDEVRSTYT